MVDWNYLENLIDPVVLNEEGGNKPELVGIPILVLFEKPEWIGVLIG